MRHTNLLRLLTLLGIAAVAPLAAQIDYTRPGVAYVQDFNLPAAAETALLDWTDNVTFPGWFAAYFDGKRSVWSTPEHVLPSSGVGKNEYAFYLYRSEPPRGATTANAPRRIDAALGSQPSDARCPGVGSGGMFYGVALTNRTEHTLHTLRLGYRVELWRVSNASAPQRTLVASCRVGGDNLVDGDWIAIPGSDYTTPRGGGGEGASPISVDGNAPENITAFTDLELGDLSIAPDQTVWIRWFDVNNRSADHGVGIDDVRITLLP